MQRAVLAHAYTAPVAAIMSAWSSSPSGLTEGSPLLEAGSAGSTDAPLAAAVAAADNAPASPLPSVSEEEPSVHSAISVHSAAGARDAFAAGLRGGSGVSVAVRDVPLFSFCRAAGDSCGLHTLRLWITALVLLVWSHGEFYHSDHCMTNTPMTRQQSVGNQ